MENKSIKISAVLHRAVKVKASEQGKSISDWIAEAIKDKFGPTKGERILDEMAVKPLLKMVYDEVAIEGTLPSRIEKKITDKNPRVRTGHITQALDELQQIGAIKLIPLPKPPAIGDQAVYRRLEW